jgi:phenylalanyl-tRNA synthetase alpha chain
MSDVVADIETNLRGLSERLREAFAGAASEPDLRALKAQALGKKGELTSVLRRLAEVPPAERKAVGERVNGAKADIERAFEERLL